MYLILGKEGCSRCEVTKRLLKKKNIQYKYKQLEDLPQEDQNRYIQLAKNSNMLNLPLIIKDNKLMNLSEVI